MQASGGHKVSEPLPSEDNLTSPVKYASASESCYESVHDVLCECTAPRFESCTEALVQTLQSYDKAALQKALGVSVSLARQAPYKCQ
ncbi:TPA: hypothetical protein ACH3X1_011869 [Trebouxia sp. C0004]